MTYRHMTPAEYLDAHPADATPPEATVTVTEWAERVGASERTVMRWLKAGKVTGAALVGGRWAIPADTPRPLDANGATAAVVTRTPTARAVVPTPAPLGHLGSLADAATVLGTTPGGVRRLARDGHLIVGPYGPRGALRVYLPPR